MTKRQRYWQTYYKKHGEESCAKRRAWYKADPGRFRQYCKNNQQKKREIINRIKCKPCIDCNKQYSPWVMDFDHTEDNKSFMISQNVAKLSIITLLKEIKKCEVVCANCHRERTHKRKQCVVYRKQRI